MSVKLRLRRQGAPCKPTFRIVATDSRSPRDGKFIEIIGFYDPRHSNEKVDLARADHWIKSGAQPSPTVASILARARAGKSLTPPPKPALPPPKPVEKPAEKVAAKPAEAAAPAAEKPVEAAATPAAAAEQPAAPAPDQPAAQK